MVDENADVKAARRCCRGAFASRYRLWPLWMQGGGRLSITDVESLVRGALFEL